MRQIQQIVNSKHAKEYDETPIVTKERSAINNAVAPASRSAREAPNTLRVSSSDLFITKIITYFLLFIIIYPTI